MKTLASLALSCLLPVLLCARADDAGQAKIGFLGIWDSLVPMVEQASSEAALPIVVVNSESLFSLPAGLRVLYVMNLATGEPEPVKQKLAEIAKTNANLKIVALDPTGEGASALGLGSLLTSDANAPVYWRNSRVTNIVRLLRYTAKTYLGETSQPVEAPEIEPDAGYYLPEQPDSFLVDFSEYTRRCPVWKENAPVAVILIRRSFCTTNNTKLMNAQIEAFRAEGFNAVALFCDDSSRLREMIARTQPDVLIETREGTVWPNDEKPTALQRLDVPYLGPVPMLASSIDEWHKDPHGLSFTDVGLFMTLQETKGVIEPIVIGGQEKGSGGHQMLAPIQERLSHAAKRALARVTLRRKPAADRKVALIYYNDNLGKDDLMRGSATGSFLDGPESMIRFLRKLVEVGYRVDDVPRDSAELLSRVRDHGRNIGPWAQGELDTMADRPDVVLLPADVYSKWFETKLSASARAAIIRTYGEPPGRLMVVQRNNQSYIVLPAVKLGNIVLAPQPLRGQTQDEKLLHSPDVPPPHNYLAFYWWLQEVFHADAVVHWGTHGSLELLPGKECGLAEGDWGDVCAGNLPIIDLWIMENLGESTLARRRSYAQLVDHMVPPPSRNGFGKEDSEMYKLHGDIEKFESLDQGVLREEFRKKIAAACRAQHIDETLKLKLEGDPPTLSDDQIGAVHSYLHQVAESRTPRSLHILGDSPPENILPEYLSLILGPGFSEHVRKEIGGAVIESTGTATGNLEQNAVWEKLTEKVIRDSVIGEHPVPVALKKDVAFGKHLLAALRDGEKEIDGLLRALDGRYVETGPGPDPIRNPASVPAGRNLYTLNPEEIPTRSSWAVAVNLVNELVKAHQPKKVALDMNGMSTMQDFGVNEGEALYLLGCRPVWDQEGLVRDFEVIPREELGRPRIDVFLALGGTYKENFPTRVALLDKAIRTVSELDEPDNPVFTNTRTIEARLRARGVNESQIKEFAHARIFGNKAGNSGTNILYLIPRSGKWNATDEITQVYLDNMSYAYTSNSWGQKVDGLYQEAMSGTDTMLRVWASNVTSELSSQYSYEYFGGLNLAIKSVTGHEPEAFIADVRDPNGVHLRTLSEVLATSLRTELLNQSWIEGMQKNGYAGAGMMAELTKNTFGWSVTRQSALSKDVWNDVYKVYMDDSYKLGLKDWFARVNPHAFQDVSATILEAARKGFWAPSEAQLAALSEAYAQSVAQFGPSSGLLLGGNANLQEFVESRLDAPGKEPLLTRFRSVLAQVSGSNGGQQKVYGPRLIKASEVKKSEPAISPSPARQAALSNPESKSFDYGILEIFVALVALFSFGFWKQWGVAR